MRALPRWVHGRGLRLLQSPLPLPAASRAQRVKAFQILLDYKFYWKDISKLTFKRSFGNLGISIVIEIGIGIGIDFFFLSMDGQYHILSIHLVVSENLSLAELETIKVKAKQQVASLGINHATIEFETRDEET